MYKQSNNNDMNTLANTTSSNNIKMMVVLVMLLVSCVGFAQNTIEVPAAVTSTTSVTTESNASMSMVSWFMGTRQTTNENITKESNSKKQMMTSGIAPNRLLIKTFLKKASQYASNIA